MVVEDIRVVAYSREHAKSISEHLFEGVPEEVVLSQREELLKTGPEEVFSVCALHGAEAVGVCTGVRMTWAGSRHRIEMIQIVVRDEFRRRGVAREMMQLIAEHFSTRGVEIVQVSAEHTNKEAIAAYQRLGFHQFGFLKDGLKFDGNYSDEVMLAAPICKMLRK
jgi:ribosomal protein S18 acetylase RimI-like enzyme